MDRPTAVPLPSWKSAAYEPVHVHVHVLALLQHYAHAPNAPGQTPETRIEVLLARTAPALSYLCCVCPAAYFRRSRLSCQTLNSSTLTRSYVRAVPTPLVSFSPPELIVGPWPQQAPWHSPPHYLTILGNTKSGCY